MNEKRCPKKQMIRWVLHIYAASFSKRKFLVIFFSDTPLITISIWIWECACTMLQWIKLIARIRPKGYGRILINDYRLSYINFILFHTCILFDWNKRKYPSTNRNIWTRVKPQPNHVWSTPETRLNYQMEYTRILFWLSMMIHQWSNVVQTWFRRLSDVVRTCFRHGSGITKTVEYF